MKWYFMIGFLLVATIMIVAGHIALYASWLTFFGIHSLKIKWALRIILAILSMSFIITSLLTYWRENTFVNALYGGSGGWLGMAWYLSLAVALTWIIYFIGRWFGVKIPLAIIASACMAMGLAYSVYGIRNAQHPVIKRVTLTIPNLPQAWKGRTAVQLSDVHLGPVHREKFLQRVVDQVKSLNPDAVFVTGDLFDGGGRDLDKLAEPLNQLNPPLGMYYITGNHETYIGLDQALAALENIHMKKLHDQMVIAAGMQIVGIDYPKMGEKKDLAAIMSHTDPLQPSIVLWHEPNHLDELKRLGANVVLSGHTHVGQIWPFNYITQAVYGANDYGLQTDGDFSQYTSSGVGTWGPPMRTGNRPEIVVIKFE
ncbi:MAG: metallophosphoesterase [Patescibacteria group bacterium]